MPYYVITRLALGSKYSDECDHCYLSLSQIVCISNLSAFLQNAQLLDATWSTDSGKLDLKVDNHGHERKVVILTDTQPLVLFDFHM